MGDNRQLRGLPSVGDVLEHPDMAEAIAECGRELVKHSAQQVIGVARAEALDGKDVPGVGDILEQVACTAGGIRKGGLQPVINATGIVLHTNLGRAPLGRDMIDEIARVAGGYCDIEFDLENAQRGNRNGHVREILKFLTTAEDALVVNNNAAGIILTLNTLALNRGVIISRGELIEIGGSFRIPEIMTASGARMVEVGSTNKTRLSDYEDAIDKDTALIFKAHKSNYSMCGFTAEVSVKELADLAHAHDLAMVYDIGSGLLRRPGGLAVEDEPDVAGAINDGADIVTFSCDKLMGGPQAGVLAGRIELISRLAEAPMMRALRVGKLTIAALSVACRHYLKDDDLASKNPTFAMLARTKADLEKQAGELVGALEKHGVQARAVESVGQCGGGTLPELRIESVAVEIVPKDKGDKSKPTFAERLYRRLLEGDRPILGVLREGKMVLDMLTVQEDEIEVMAEEIGRRT
ncbi:L-seryl-tRNA(Sec) selenium transferase [Verrucomicrobiota bacterium]